ncbi:hypothetical protein ACP0HM_23070 [Escherichia coli]
MVIAGTVIGGGMFAFTC